MNLSPEVIGVKKKQPKALVFPQVKAALIASLGNFICGTINAWSASTLIELDEEFKMGDTGTSIVASIIAYGALLGSLLSGKAMDALGRKKLMMVVAPFAAVGWVIIGLASNIYLVYIGRFLCGFASGFFLISCPVYTSETSQSYLRGRLSSLPMLTLTVGVLASYVFGGLFSFRVSAFICAIPVVIFFCALFFIPETPYWYLLHGKEVDAIASLRILRGSDFNVEMEIQEILLKLSYTKTNNSYMELLNRRTLLPLIIALFIQTLQQFCGGNVVMVFTGIIFQDSNSNQFSPEVSTIFTGVVQLLGALTSIFVIDKFGRRYLLSTSVFLCGAFMALLGGYFLTFESENPWPSWLPIVIISLGLYFYCLGCRSIPWLIGTEIFNTSIRSRANSVVVCYNRILNIIVIQIYPYAVSYFGYATVYFSYGAACLLFTIGTLLIVPETKGKSLEEMQEYFENKASKRADKKQTVNNKSVLLPPI